MPSQGIHLRAEVKNSHALININIRAIEEMLNALKVPGNTNHELSVNTCMSTIKRELGSCLENLNIQSRLKSTTINASPSRSIRVRGNNASRVRATSPHKAVNRAVSRDTVKDKEHRPWCSAWKTKGKEKSTRDRAIESYVPSVLGGESGASKSSSRAIHTSTTNIPVEKGGGEGETRGASRAPYTYPTQPRRESPPPPPMHILTDTDDFEPGSISISTALHGEDHRLDGVGKLMGLVLSDAFTPHSKRKPPADLAFVADSPPPALSGMGRYDGDDAPESVLRESGLLDAQGPRSDEAGMSGPPSQSQRVEYNPYGSNPYGRNPYGTGASDASAGPYYTAADVVVDASGRGVGVDDMDKDADADMNSLAEMPPDAPAPARVSFHVPLTHGGGVESPAHRGTVSFHVPAGAGPTGSPADASVVSSSAGRRPSRRAPPPPRPPFAGPAPAPAYTSPAYIPAPASTFRSPAVVEAPALRTPSSSSSIRALLQGASALASPEKTTDRVDGAIPSCMGPLTDPHLLVESASCSPPPSMRSSLASYGPSPELFDIGTGERLSASMLYDGGDDLQL
jgi:hypothetical protein